MKMMKLDKDLGTLEAGKLADIIAVDGNPAHDITVLQRRENSSPPRRFT